MQRHDQHFLHMGLLSHDNKQHNIHTFYDLYGPREKLLVKQFHSLFFNYVCIYDEWQQSNSLQDPYTLNKPNTSNSHGYSFVMTTAWVICCLAWILVMTTREYRTGMGVDLVHLVTNSQTTVLQLLYSVQLVNNEWAVSWEVNSQLL